MFTISGRCETPIPERKLHLVNFNSGALRFCLSVIIISKLVMDSDAVSDSEPVTLASAISQARLEAFQSLAEGDYNKFLALTKECIDVHVQATKAMINDIGKRISSGENFDWPREMSGLKEGLFHYCQAIVNEAESLVPESVDKPITLSSYLPRHPTSVTTATRYSKFSPNFSSISASFSSSSSGPNTFSSIIMSESSDESHLVREQTVICLVCLISSSRTSLTFLY